MPATRFRSRTFRRVFVRVPGGDAKLRYRRRKNGKPQCADCGGILAGVPQGTKAIIQALPKNQRRPERPFGGKLCSPCSRRELIARAQKNSGPISTFALEGVVAYWTAPPVHTEQSTRALVEWRRRLDELRNILEDDPDGTIVGF